MYKAHNKINKITSVVILFMIAINIQAGHSKNNLALQEGEFVYDTILSRADFEASVEKDHPKCYIFLDSYQGSLNRKNLSDCLIENRDLTPTIVDKLLTRKRAVSQKTLDEVLKLIIISTLSTRHTKTIKKLIDAGASTENFNVRIYSGNDIACGAVLMILEKNKKFYQRDDLLGITVDGFPRGLDLHFLTNTGIGRGLCPEAIPLLVSFNQKLINFQSEYDHLSPLHEYLYDVRHSDWDMNTAKLLMSKGNINLQTKQGNTALHYLLLYNQEDMSDKIIELIANALKLGADLTLKNEHGVTVKDLIMKRPDLKSVK